MFFIRKIFPLLTLLLIGFLVTAPEFTKPFFGHHDFNGVYYSTMARNYLNYGMSTKLGQVTNAGLASPENFTYHTHYPSLYPLLLAGGYALFGFSEIVARSLSVIFTSLTIYLLYLIARKLSFSFLASASVTLILFTPMLRYFGKLPVHEPLVLLFTVASVWFYLSKRFSWFILAAFLSSQTSWPGYFLYPLLALYAYFHDKKNLRPTLLALVAIALGLLLHFVHIFILTGNPLGGGLIDALLFRLNLSQVTSSGPDLVGFTWAKYLVQQMRWLTVYYTFPVLIAAALWGAGLLIKVIKRVKLSLADKIIFTLYLFGLSYPLVFPNMVFIHDYFNIFFYPALALSLAQSVDRFFPKRPYLALPLLLLFTWMIFSERLPFLQALNRSNMHQTGHELGKLINQQIPVGQSVAVFSINYADHHGPFISYYADRHVGYYGYGLDGWGEFITITPQPAFAVTVSSHRLDDLIIDRALATQSASINRFPNFTFYQLNQSATIE